VGKLSGILGTAKGATHNLDGMKSTLVVIAERQFGLALRVKTQEVDESRAGGGNDNQIAVERVVKIIVDIIRSGGFHSSARVEIHLYCRT
jgi:hypothetical protein